MRVAIVGSRDFPSPFEAVTSYYWKRLRDVMPDLHLVSGGAPGIDKAVQSLAISQSIPLTEWRVKQSEGFRVYRIELRDWNPQSLRWDYLVPAEELYGDGSQRAYPTFGRAAFARNRYIVRGAAKAVAFWNGTSRGTKHDIDLALTLHVPLEVIFP